MSLNRITQTITREAKTSETSQPSMLAPARMTDPWRYLQHRTACYPFLIRMHMTLILVPAIHLRPAVASHSPAPEAPLLDDEVQHIFKTKDVASWRPIVIPMSRPGRDSEWKTRYSGDQRRDMIFHHIRSFPSI